MAQPEEDKRPGDTVLGPTDPPQPYSVDNELANSGSAPDGLFPSAVRPAVFRTLWITLAILLAMLLWVAVDYGHTVGW